MKWPRAFRRAERLAENAQELQFYLEAETEDNMARGMSRGAAYSAARRKLGNSTSIREDVYRMNSWTFLETTWQDVRYSLRTMRKNGAFTLTALLTLALGIGGNTAAFSVIHAVLLKPLRYGDPDRLVQVTADYPRRNVWNTTFTKQQFDEVRKATQSFTGLGAFLWSQENVTISGNSEPEALKAARVSANFLNILGIAPIVGRGFLPEEEERSGPPVAMISARLWKRRFDGNPQIIGETVDLNSTPYTIIGVLPQTFTFPFPSVDVWVTKPSEWSVLPPRSWDISTSLIGFGRLKPGMSLERARAEMNVLNRQYAMADPGKYVARMQVAWLSDQVVASVRPTLWILFGAVGFVLLIGCANVAGLLLARARSRSREFAVRAAVGAPRGRLIRQLLAESVVLSSIGGVLGLLLAKWALSAITHISALNLPGVAGIRLDGNVLGFATALSVLTGLLFGVFPAWQISRPDVADTLRQSSAAAASGKSDRSRVFAVDMRGLLVVGQIALSTVLLIGATLLMKSFARLQSVDPGFQPENLLTAKIALPPARYDTGLKRVAFIDEFVRRVEAIPGVRSAALAMSLPTTSWLRTNIQIEGKPWEADPGNWPSVQIQSVTPGYFRTLGIPIERGRQFATRDNSFGSPPAVIINESFARRFWPAYPGGQDPVGQHLREGADRTDWVEIVGIVADVHEGGLAMDTLPEFYVPCVIHPPQTAYLVVRTQGDSLQFVSAVRKQVQAIDPDEPLSDVGTMDKVLASTLGQRWLATLLVASFAGVAALLAVIGIYGVIGYSVAQRSQELGIRRALGAQQSDILRLVLSHALSLAVAGVVIGVFGAFVLMRVVRGLLYHISATDPMTFIATGVLFVLIALGASFIPARRAARIEPMAALRMG